MKISTDELLDLIDQVERRTEREAGPALDNVMLDRAARIQTQIDELLEQRHALEAFIAEMKPGVEAQKVIDKLVPEVEALVRHVENAPSFISTAARASAAEAWLAGLKTAVRYVADRLAVDVDA